MDAKELRNGNNIYLVDVKNVSHRVIGTVKDMKFSIGHSKISCPLYELVMEPVEITDKILVSNGFQKDMELSGRYYFPKGTSTFFVKYDIEKGNFYIGMEDAGDDRRVSIPLTYVHELQNAAYFIRGMEIGFTE